MNLYASGKWMFPTMLASSSLSGGELRIRIEWKKGGSIAWREYDASMRSVSEVGRLPAGVSVWSFVASYYDQDDGIFYILH